MIEKIVFDRERRIEFKVPDVRDQYIWEEFRDTVMDFIHDYADTDAFCASFAMGEKGTSIKPVYSEFVSVRDPYRAMDVFGNRLLSPDDNPNAYDALWESYRDDILSIWDSFENWGKPNPGVLELNGVGTFREIAKIIRGLIRNQRKFPEPDRFPTSDS